MNSKTLYIGASINIAQAQCKSPKKLHYQWSPVLSLLLFHLDQLYPCGHALPTSRDAYTVLCKYIHNLAHVWAYE